jgi:beta-glucosidase
MISWLKGKAQGDEAFHVLRNGIFAPGLGVARTPFNGRNSEYMGEDPILAGTLAARWIRAMREATPGEPVMAAVKHYVGNDQEIDQGASSSNIDARTLHEIYELEFAVANEGKPAGVMTSYNQVNGIYAGENPITLNQDLFGEIGFQGYTVSDNYATRSTAPSLNAGLDQESGAPIYFSPTNLHAALAAGTITTQQIYNAAFRVVRSFIANGVFDNPLPATASTNSSTPEHLDIALKMAEEGTVLLKNDNILPITAKGKKIAVIGPTASNVATNGVSAQTVCTASAGLVVSCPTPAAPLDAITARAAELGDTVIFDNGSDPAVSASIAAAADITIVFGYNTEGEHYDLPNLNLFNNGDALIEAVAAANPKTIVIVETGSALLMPWIDQVQGVFEAWYPGVQQGPAIAALLFGDVNPSGKLPVTFPKQLADLPTGVPPNAQYPGLVDGSTTRPAGNSDIRQVSYSEGLFTGYRWYDTQGIAPLFPFGFGLSYTSFAYSHLKMEIDKRDHNIRRISVAFQVTNVGNRAGCEIAQVYLGLPAGIGEPPKRLVGWSRVDLRAGETRYVTVTIRAESPAHPLSYWDLAQSQWVIADGTYRLYVGASSADLRLSDNFKVKN